MSASPSAMRAPQTLHPWERFALSDPFAYILTSFDGDLDRFWASGAQVAEQILSDVAPYLSRRRVVTEIGCGVGRCLFPMAERFDRAVGVDISPTMLTLLRRYAAERGVATPLATFLPAQPWAEQRADLIFSTRVFRHIDSRRVIGRYLAGVGQALAPGGVAHLQFNTRAPTLGYRVRNALPDVALPMHWRQGARGVRLPRAIVLSMLEQHGLHVLHERAPHSDSNSFVVVKP